jgi:hypothetical protein
LILAVGLLAVGCGGAGDEVDGGSSQEAVAIPEQLPVAKNTTLNELEVGGDQITFIEVVPPGGQPEVGILTASSADRHLDVVGRLQAENGLLTSLELFYGLAGEVGVPHERLVQAHAAEAKALGRADDTLKLVELQPLQTDKAFTTSTCDWFLFDTSYVYQDPTDGGTWAYYERTRAGMFNTGTTRRDLCIEDSCGERWRTGQVAGHCSAANVTSRWLANDGNGWFLVVNWTTHSGSLRYYRPMPGVDTHLSIQSKNAQGQFSQAASKLQFDCAPTSQSCKWPGHIDMVLGGVWP